MIVFLLFILLFGAGFVTVSAAVIYRRMYYKLRYLALSGCEFKERKGDLVAHHPLMKENRWELLSDAYSFAAKPRNHREELGGAPEFEDQESGTSMNESDSDRYEPGSWKTKENAIEE